MEKFLETYNLPKLNQEKAESLNRLIISNEIEAVIKKLPAPKNLDWIASQENFTKHVKKG